LDGYISPANKNDQMNKKNITLLGSFLLINITTTQASSVMPSTTTTTPNEHENAYHTTTDKKHTLNARAAKPLGNLSLNAQNTPFADTAKKETSPSQSFSQYDWEQKINTLKKTLEKIREKASKTLTNSQSSLSFELWEDYMHSFLDLDDALTQEYQRICKVMSDTLLEKDENSISQKHIRNI
jgi:hypothetical protein